MSGKGDVTNHWDGAPEAVNDDAHLVNQAIEEGSLDPTTTTTTTAEAAPIVPPTVSHPTYLISGDCLTMTRSDLDPPFAISMKRMGGHFLLRSVNGVTFENIRITSFAGSDTTDPPQERDIITDKDVKSFFTQCNLVVLQLTTMSPKEALQTLAKEEEAKKLPPKLTRCSPMVYEISRVSTDIAWGCKINYHTLEVGKLGGMELSHAVSLVSINDKPIPRGATAKSFITEAMQALSVKMRFSTALVLKK